MLRRYAPSARGTAAALATAALALLSMASTTPAWSTTGQAVGASGMSRLRTRQRSSTPDASNMTYQGGRVMQSSDVNYLILWEPPTLQTGQSTHVSPTYNSLIQRYFNDVGGKGLYNANTQYYERKGGSTRYIVNNSTLGGVWVDTSAYPLPGCVDPVTPGNCVSDAQIQSEVTKAMNTNGWSASYNHMFFVFTSYGEGSCSGALCSFSSFCAYHSFFNKGAQPVIYANMPYTGTLLTGCGTPTTPNNDIDADSTINVTSHEQMEAVTDPKLNAWYDGSRAENGDKCAWNFGPLNYNGGTANQSWNGHYYILQQEWSNAGSRCVQTYP